MKVKILGVVFALPPLSSPDRLLDRFIRWRTAQILGPALLRLRKAMHRTAVAIEKFVAAYQAALEGIGSELLEEIESESGEEW